MGPKICSNNNSEQQNEIRVMGHIRNARTRSLMTILKALGIDAKMAPVEIKINKPEKKRKQNHEEAPQSLD